VTSRIRIYGANHTAVNTCSCSQPLDPDIQRAVETVRYWAPAVKCNLGWSDSVVWALKSAHPLFVTPPSFLATVEYEERLTLQPWCATDQGGGGQKNTKPPAHYPSPLPTRSQTAVLKIPERCGGRPTKTLCWQGRQLWRAQVNSWLWNVTSATQAARPLSCYVSLLRLQLQVARLKSFWYWRLSRLQATMPAIKPNSMAWMQIPPPALLFKYGGHERTTLFSNSARGVRKVYCGKRVIKLCSVASRCAAYALSDFLGHFFHTLSTFSQMLHSVTWHTITDTQRTVTHSFKRTTHTAGGLIYSILTIILTPTKLNTLYT
jgi:hypothetical protein